MENNSTRATSLEVMHAARVVLPPACNQKPEIIFYLLLGHRDPGERKGGGKNQRSFATSAAMATTANRFFHIYFFLVDFQAYVSRTLGGLSRIHHINDVASRYIMWGTFWPPQGRKRGLSHTHFRGEVISGGGACKRPRHQLPILPRPWVHPVTTWGNVHM